MKFNEFLEQKRLELGLNKQQFRKKMGIFNSQLSSWERGVSKPYPLTLKRIAENLEVDLEFLESLEFGIPWPKKNGFPSAEKLEKLNKNMFIPIENDIQKNATLPISHNQNLPVQSSNVIEAVKPEEVSTGELLPKGKIQMIVDADVSVSISKDIQPEKLIKIFNLIKEI